jgi:signal transduction histidine kinase
VRNPLFAMSATVDAMQLRMGENPSTDPFIEALRRELDRLNALMRDLLEYGRPTEAKLLREPLGPVINAALRMCQPLAEKQQVKLENAVADAGEVAMDAGRLILVFQNLVDNAIRHSPAGSVVRLESARTELGEREAIEIRVLDQGPGFNAQDLGRVFEPFFTRRRGGIGLGLSIVQKITEQHGGQVTPRNRPHGGASVSVLLPR